LQNKEFVYNGVSMKKVYLDYAASTPVDASVIRKMTPFWRKYFGNPYSIHAKGKEAKEFVEKARHDIAALLSVQKRELIFTSGGTEANNLALLGVLRKGKETIQNSHIIVSSIEHSSLLEGISLLEQEGVSITRLPVSENGVVLVRDLERALTKNTVFVSVMLVNNETGTKEPIHKLSQVIKKWRESSKSNYPYFHTDASQAARYLPINPEGLGVDLMTLDGQKMYGPKGIGLLYVKEEVLLKPLFYGGGQEHGIRSGTENVPGIIGFSQALSLISKVREKDLRHTWKLKKSFLEGLSQKGISFHVNGGEDTVPGILNLSFPDIASEELLISLDTKGICVAIGSACTNRKRDVSHVIEAMHGKERADHAIRLSFGRETKESDIRFVVSALEEILKKSVY
jgi:cysteine desulfurase